MGSRPLSRGGRTPERSGLLKPLPETGPREGTNTFHALQKGVSCTEASPIHWWLMGQSVGDPPPTPITA